MTDFNNDLEDWFKNFSEQANKEVDSVLDHNGFDITDDEAFCCQCCIKSFDQVRDELNFLKLPPPGKYWEISLIIPCTKNPIRMSLSMAYLSENLMGESTDITESEQKALLPHRHFFWILADVKDE